MPPPEKEGGLRPIVTLGLAEVPKAGRQELAEFKNGQKTTKASLFMWWGLAFISTAVTVALFPLGFIAYGLFLTQAIAFGSIGVMRFWQLATAKTWKALPNGASESTALLEDDAAKSVREWNWEAQRWNLDLAALNAEIDAWRRRGEDPALRDEDWCEETHGMGRDTLMAKGLELKFRRKLLFAAKRDIGRAARLLKERMRPPPDEPQKDDDPEPDDG